MWGDVDMSVVRFIVDAMIVGRHRTPLAFPARDGFGRRGIGMPVFGSPVHTHSLYAVFAAPPGEPLGLPQSAGNA
jgi:hypothetical protein